MNDQPEHGFQVGSIEMLAIAASAQAIHQLAHMLHDGFVHDGAQVDALDSEEREQYDELVAILDQLVNASHMQGAALIEVVGAKMADGIGSEAEAFLASLDTEH